MSDTRRSRRGLALSGLLVLAAVGVWFLLREPEPPEPPPPDERAEERAPPEPPPPAHRSAPLPALAPPPPAKEEVADDGLPYMPADPNAPRPDGPVHPHPITAEHQRIFAENRLVGALNGAMDTKDVAGMRKLLQQYRDEYPEDANDLQVGFGIIADCLEHPGSAVRAAAVRFNEEHRGSTVRRFVNRHCLEAQPTP